METVNVLTITERAVKGHRASTYCKFGVDYGAVAVAGAACHGWLTQA